MKRRRFLQLGCAAATSALAPSAAQALQSVGAVKRFELEIEPVDQEMIDGKLVYMLLFFQGSDNARPILRVTEADSVEIQVTNRDDRPHGFAINGIPAATIASVPPGATAGVQFQAPAGGTYLYHDPTDAPLNRLLGLHGAFIIDPLLGTTLAGSPTPYSRTRQTPAIRSLFDALGRTRRFPGEQWKPNDPDRDKIWVFSATDSKMNARAAAGERATGQALINGFYPDYFHINGRSGFDTADHNGTPDEEKAAAKAIMPACRQGQPTLIRTLNAGIACHSPHIHGNHVMECASHNASGAPYCLNNIYERDVWQLKPMGLKDVLLPFEKPPDAVVWPPRQEPFPLRYVMHCHTEMSQTAAGGNYPMGLVTHWEMTGPLAS